MTAEEKKKKIEITQDQFTDLLEQISDGFDVMSKDVFVPTDTETTKLFVTKIEIKISVIQPDERGTLVASVQRNEDGSYVFN